MQANQPTPAQSKRSIKKQERAAALAKAIAEAQSLLKPPPELSSAGVVKTRCWVALHDKLRRQLALRKPCVERIQNLNWNMRDWSKLDADGAHRVTENLKPKPKAKKVEAHV